MKDYVLQVFEYAKVIEEISKYALSEQAKLIIENLKPDLHIDQIKKRLKETSGAVRILEVNSSIPLTSLDKIQQAALIVEGRVLTIEELSAVKELLRYVKRMQKFMDSMNSIAPEVAGYASSMFDLPELYQDLDRCLVNGRVDDRATPELNRLRKQIRITDDKIKQKINSILSSPAYASVIQEALVTSRNGRYVIPVKRQFAKNIAGSILDRSSSGSTLFIEPAAISALQSELDMLMEMEAEEVYRVLAQLTEMVKFNSQEISIDIETMAHYDALFARAKYSKSINGTEVALNVDGIINIKGGRHPLLGEDAVPLDFSIGTGCRALVITGPNTGGKTVTLKTVGLLTLMVQSGLHVPVEPGSQMAIFNDILADIGDGQSIEQSLSTFSSHVKNIVEIISGSRPNSLVVMDEIGAGTEPEEGMGFAIAVMEEVFNRGATILATTHISEIKQFAEKNPGFKNACMEFDLESLRPLYRLKIGQAGSSNAFLIALRLGVDRSIIERAHEITYRDKKDYSASNLDNLAPAREQRVESQQNAYKEGKLPLKKRPSPKYGNRFQKGDCVFISSMNRTGIVYEPENSRGEVVVMVMKKKYKINQKRLSLHIEAQDLYPENYDLDIVFESKENRKKRKQFSKHHVEGVVIETPTDE